MKNIVVIYHGGCDDGFGGAWAAWKKFGARAIYIGAVDRNGPPKGVRGKEVYLIDYTYKLPVVEKMMRENKRVTAIDHHVTAREAVMRSERYSFDLNHSGAVLAWKYFHPHRPVPTLFKYIEDIDLWRFRLHNTPALAAFLDSHPFDFKAWGRLARDFEDAKKRKEFAAIGNILLASDHKSIRAILERGAEPVRFAGHRAYAVNSPVWSSKLGHELSEMSRGIGIVWSVQKGKIVVSLRSIGNLDVGKIAARFGGGGHKNAAGFTLPEGAKLPWKGKS